MEGAVKIKLVGGAGGWYGAGETCQVLRIMELFELEGSSKVI